MRTRWSSLYRAHFPAEFASWLLIFLICRLPRVMAEVLIRSDAEKEPQVVKQGEFRKLSDCPKDFQADFNRAKEAIEGGNLTDLKDAVAKMKSNEGVTPEECRVNVCEMVSECAVSLLAYAGYHSKKEMMTTLLREGADIDMGNRESGNPLLQMMVYAFKLDEAKPRMDAEIVQFFVDEHTELSRVLMAPDCNQSTAFELAVFFQRLDLVEVLVKAGVDPILCGDGSMSPLLLEYVIFGTHQVLWWLLNHHYSTPQQRSNFIDRLISTGVLFRRSVRNTFSKTYGKNPVHALLLCGHREFIRELVQKGPHLVEQRRQLVEKRVEPVEERDPFGRTALHLAAEEGDTESVSILLDCNAAVHAVDDGFLTPLMLATKNEHKEVIIEMFRNGRGTRDRTNLLVLWTWALQHSFISCFEVLHTIEDLEDVLLDRIDNNGNTIAHIAAEGGHVSIFKVSFPKTHNAPLFKILTEPNDDGKTALQLAIENGNIGILTALQERREERARAAAESEEPFDKQAEEVEKSAWNDFWNDSSPGLLLYACLHGTVDTVKYFVSRLVSPTARHQFEGRTPTTPLELAAEAGKHETVAYLLSIPGVSAEGVPSDQRLSEEERKRSPLMLASMGGHAKCVTLLLEKGADVSVMSGRQLRRREGDVRREGRNLPGSEQDHRSYNCLMEAIERGHKSVAVALLSHSDTWRTSMRHCVEENGRSITPMRMLIEEMPSVSKMVLTKCIEPPGQSSRQIVYDFQFIEDYVDLPTTTGSQVQPVPSGTQGGAQSIQMTQPPQPNTRGSPTDESQSLLVTSGQGGGRQREEEVRREPLLKSSQYSPPGHPLSLMVKYKRLELLNHPLIHRYISRKWWRVSFPLFLFSLVSYIIFLIFLTSFSLTLPRPGPQNTFCPSNESTNGFTQLNFQDGSCQDPDVADRRVFTALAVILILMSVAYIVVKPIFHYMWRETSDIWDHVELVFQIVLFLLTIVFVSGFANDCWCTPPWQWQIGALVMFMAYFNLILLLKAMPLLGVGVPINMLLNIIITFVKLAFLPVLLVLAFGFPFYMLFVRGDGLVIPFSTPASSLAKVIMQFTGELDYGGLFDEGSLLYSPMTYILFITFVILMPVLFNNLLVGLAVGTAEEDTKQAELTNIRLQVEYIVQLEDVRLVFRRPALSTLKVTDDSSNSCCPSSCLDPLWVWIDKKRKVDYDTQAEAVEELYEDLLQFDGGSKDVQESVEVVKDKVAELAATMESLQMSVSVMERNQRHLHETINEVKKLAGGSMETMQKQLKEILDKLP